MDKIITDLKALRQLSLETSRDEITALNLKARLREANKTAWTPGCGLAAIQIGVALRYAWFEYAKEEFELINPEIVFKSGKFINLEGCLSIPNRHVRVERYHEIEYISDGKKKRAKGFKACIIQHEIDHMDGVLNIDKEVV
jgi:peptide deformylase